jgi:SAM-dependent methyltransferase
MANPELTRPDYGIDAPGVLRNLLLFGALCLAVAVFAPPRIRLGPVVLLSRSFYWPAGFLLGEGLLFLLYVKAGKFRHRDRMLALHNWRGDEQVLDVGCGRGLLLVGAAKRLTTGHATGIDIWSKVDLSGNSVEATEKNLELERVAVRCTLLGEGAQKMSFPDNTFDVILSNLCLHNIYDKPTRRQALAEIVRVLKPGGTAILSDYKLTGEYAELLRKAGLEVDRKSANWLTTFPPLTIVIARKPL